MVLLKKDIIKKALIQHKNQITELKNQLKIISEQINSNEITLKKTNNENPKVRISQLEQQIKTLNEKYIYLLEMLVDAIGNQKQTISDSLSNSGATNQVRKTPIGLESFQILFLMEQSRAKSPEFAVSATQLKLAFNIDKTEKTIRNKLNKLEKQGFIKSISKKPKRFYLTPEAMSFILNQQNKLFQIQ